MRLHRLPDPFSSVDITSFQTEGWTCPQREESHSGGLVEEPEQDVTKSSESGLFLLFRELHKFSTACRTFVEDRPISVEARLEQPWLAN